MEVEKQILKNYLRVVLNGGGQEVKLGKLKIVTKDIDISELTYERALSQENRYRNVVETYRRVPLENRFGITLWGMRDVDSWLLNHHNNPLEYPLLFDIGYNTKIAHRGFAEGLIE